MRMTMMTRGGRALVVFPLLGVTFAVVQQLWSGPAGAPPVTPTAYVSNRGTAGVTPIDISSNSPGGTIGVGQTPTGVAIAPNAQAGYVAKEFSPSVSAIATGTNSASTIGTPGGSTPTMLAITPNGTTAYVISTRDNTVIPIDLATNSAQTAIGLPARTGPVDIAITPNGQTAYVVGINTVVPINLGNGSVGTPIPAPGGPTAIAISPNGQFAYVVGRFANNVTPINLSNNSPQSPVSLPAGTNPISIAVTPNGQEAYVVGSNGNPPYGLSITPINLASPGSPTPVQLVRPRVAQDRRPLAACPQSGQIAIVPAGNEAFVTDSCFGDTFAVSLGALSSPTVINAGPQPWGVAVTPDQAPTAAFSATPAPPGSPTSFDASASSSPVGTIASYAWDFGDGKTQSTSSPTISHTYSSAGTYTVKLTVTNTQGTSTTQTFTGKTVSNNGGPSAQVSHGVPVTTPGGPPPPPVTPPPTPTPGGPAPIPVPPNVTTPTLLVSPTVGPPGTIVTVEGVAFPANTAVTVNWSTQTGSVTATSTASGLFLAQMYILTPDVLGPRTAQAAGYPTAQAQFLVVPGTSEPGGDNPELLFRNEST